MTNPILTHNTIYQIVKDIVAAYPATRDISNTYNLNCKQPQAFAVLQSDSQINTDNLAKDRNYINTPYFFARNWNIGTQSNPSQINHEYPLVVMTEGAAELFDAVGNSKHITTYELHILDKMPSEKSAALNPCGNRVVEDISQDLRLIWNRIWVTLKRYVWATITIVSTSQTGSNWYSQDWLNAAQLAGTITNVETGIFLVSYFDAAFGVTTEVFYHTFKNDLCGFFSKFRLRIDYCTTPIMDFDYLNNLTLESDKGCC
jgi:hypothetical protein